MKLMDAERNVHRLVKKQLDNISLSSLGYFQKWKETKKLGERIVLSGAYTWYIFMI